MIRPGYDGWRPLMALNDERVNLVADLALDDGRIMRARVRYGAAHGRKFIAWWPEEPEFPDQAFGLVDPLAWRLVAKGLSREPIGIPAWAL